MEQLKEKIEASRMPREKKAKLLRAIEEKQNSKEVRK
jgi:hypothetical protein